MREPREPLRIYVGYDEREDDAYRVCVHSLRRHASRDLDIRALEVHELVSKGIYTRTWYRCHETGVKIDKQDGRPFSTDFAFTRFLVPALARAEGVDWALFVDCDFLFTADVAALFALADPRYALMCVKHEHSPRDGVKMDGQVQSRYRRKNWSSLMLWNLGDVRHAALTAPEVSRRTGSWLHGFRWLDDDAIGGLPETWNHLCGYTQPPSGGRIPKAIHYTSGGPWFPEQRHVPYAGEWLLEQELVLEAEAQAA